MTYRIFCDFDGTITQQDIGNLIFHKFGDSRHWDDVVQEWKNRRIDGRTLWRRQVAVSNMTEQDVDEFIRDKPIDPSFPSFVEFCRILHIPIVVLSDGMDVYIQKIVRRHGLDHLTVKSNRLFIHESGELDVEFPYFEQGCGWCANCKGGHIQITDPADTTIYIGDGHSDICALDAADVTFAKKDLLAYCRHHNRDCIAFENFNDIKHWLITQLETKSG